MNAIICWQRTGVYVDHVYGFTYEPAIIITSKHSVRVSENYNHAPDEVLYKNACLIQGECKYCGKKVTAWQEDYNAVIEVVKKIPALRDVRFENSNLDEESVRFWKMIENVMACGHLKNSGEYIPPKLSKEQRRRSI